MLLLEKYYTYLCENGNQEEVGSASQNIITLMYGMKINIESTCRHQIFLENLAGAKFTLARLTPTNDAAKYNGLRTHLQMEQ